jgi:hypothetical protein
MLIHQETQQQIAELIQQSFTLCRESENLLQEAKNDEKEDRK